MAESQHGGDNVIENFFCCEQLQPCSPKQGSCYLSSFSAARTLPFTAAASAAKQFLAVDKRFDAAYADDVFVWKKSLEGSYHPVGCLSNQPEVTSEMRFKLLQWLTQVNRQFDYTLETLCLAVNYIDRFLAITPIQPTSLQLLGVAALLVAAKKEEVHPPDLSEITRLCGGAYEKTHVRRMEVLLLSALRFKLSAPTPSYFLDYYLFCSKVSSASYSSEAARCLVETSLCSYALCQFQPSLLAAAAVILTHDLLQSALLLANMFPQWEILELDRCIFAMSALVQNNRTGMLRVPHSLLAASQDVWCPGNSVVDEARQRLVHALSLAVPSSLILQ